MNYYYFLILCLFCLFIPEKTAAQSLSAPCGSDYWHKKNLQDPDLFQKYQGFEKGVLQVFENPKTSQDSPEMAKVIPVVVHIIHDGGAENLSDAQVQQAISWLNQALANQGSFNQGSGADCGIQLCLAQRTPDNQPTNGITRDQSPLTEMQMESQDMQVKNINRWEPKDYVNIWLVRSICSSIYGCNVYGYSNYPYAHGLNRDGIMIEAGYVAELGKIGGLAHEIGHYLGLYHTFEGGCNNNNCMTDGDRVCDTPPDKSTAGIPCGQTVSTCSSDTQSGPFTTDQPDMTWNFLDYGMLSCFHDYTAGQATRMNASLDGVRHSLLDSKGCLPPCPAPTLAGFTPSATAITVGETVMFSNNSQNAASYTWTVNGTSFGNLPNAAFTFTDPGTYTVVLTVQPSNPTLCDVSTATVVIQVVCNVTAGFSVNDPTPDENQTILITNTSQNATQLEWFLNGVSQGNSLDSISFPTEGYYDIELVAKDGPCQSSYKVEVLVKGVCEDENRLFQFTYQGPPLSEAVGRGVVVLEDGNLLFLINYFNVSSFVGLIKMTPGGQQLWAKRLGGNTENYWTDKGLVATSDGGFAVSFLGGDSVNTTRITKYSSNGDELWMFQFPDSVSLNDLTTSPDGKITACGGVFVQNEHQMLFVQLDADGNLLWIKKYFINGGSAGHTITNTPDGGFVGTGINGHLFRLMANGQMMWHLRIQGSIMTDAIVLASGDIVACGGSGTKGRLLKLFPDGNPYLIKQYSTGTNSAFFNNIIQDGDLGFILTARSQASGRGSVLGLDSVGNVRWTRRYTTQQGGFFEDLIAYKDIGLILTGARYDPPGSAWILKTDRRGLIGDCPTEPFVVTETNLAIPSSIESIIIEVPPPTLEQTSVTVHDWPVMLDTICAIACATPLEICNNNLDDDGDGLFDCLDSECSCTEDQCAPKQANIWYFGQNAGLDFSVEPPKVLADGKTKVLGISATMNDAEGNLMFYTDGDTIFNRLHQPMLNGNLQFGWDITNYILPHPGNSSINYVFCSQFSTVFYSIVDMTLDEGRGAVVIGQKNIALTNLAYGLAAVKSCAFKGFWVLTRKAGLTNEFFAFRLDQNGLDTQNPVQSNTDQAVGAVIQMKISPDGHRVACAAQAYNNPNKYLLTIHDFDPSTSGAIFNSRILEEYVSPTRAIGVEFSPNSRYLYVTGEFDGFPKVLQYDMEAGDLNAIRNSKVVVETKASNIIMGYPQLGPNGKIYLTAMVNFSPVGFTLDVINQPNLTGLACQYQPKGQSLDPSSAVRDGLCNFLPSYFTEPYINFPYDAPDTICTLNAPVFYQIKNVQCNVDSIFWKTENLSAQIVPNYQYATIRFLTPGTGRLIVTAHTPCGIVSDTLDVLVVAPLNKTLQLGPNLVVCQNGVFSFNAGSGFAKYQWSDGTADSTLTTLFPGKYWVNVWDICGNFQTDTITVSIAPNSVLDLGPDLPQQCSGFSVNYQRPANFDTWQWSPNDFLSCVDCPNISLSPTTSARWVVVAQTVDGCISVDTLNATIRDTLLFSRDTLVCEGQTLSILGMQLPADTSAQFFLPAPGAGCDTLLTINVLGLENASSEMTVTICPNAFYTFNGALLPADTVAVFHFSSALACDSVLTLRVNSYPALNLALPMDTTIRIGASVLLESETSGAGTLDFAWSPTDGLSCFDCPDPLANPLDTITYTLAVTDGNGCTAQESVTVRVNEECRVRIPNAFTPNGDGANDLFRPIMDPCVKTVRLWKILNRWGQTVFEQINFPAEDPSLGWDGTWKGKAQPSDVLIWVAEFEYYDGRRESTKGEVTLVR